jgi:hypothetical protein
VFGTKELRNTSGMILTWENRSTWRKTFPIVNAHYKYTVTSLGLNLGLNVERMVTNCQSQDMITMVLTTSLHFTGYKADWNAL